MFEKYKDVVKIEDVCEMLNISRTSAIKLTRSNFKYCRVGHLYRIQKQSIIDYIETGGGVSAICQEG